MPIWFWPATPTGGCACSGRTGGSFVGKDVNATVTGLPWLAAAAVVAGAYDQLHLDYKRNN